MPNESFEYEASPASAERSKTPETELKELKETVGLLQNSLASVSAALGQVDRRLAGINSLRPNKTEAAPSFETDLDALDADGLMRLIEEHTDGMTERGKAYARDLLVYFRALQESSPEEILTNWVDGDC